MMKPLLRVQFVGSLVASALVAALLVWVQQSSLRQLQIQRAFELYRGTAETVMAESSRNPGSDLSTVFGLEHARQVLAAPGKSPASSSSQTISGYITDLLAAAERGETADVRARMTEDMERELCAQAIQRAGGNPAKAARWLGITRLTMREKLLHYGLHPDP